MARYLHVQAMQNHYILDETDRLIRCGGDWDAFALQNDSKSAVAARVVGYRLWDFLADFETTSYLNGIFFWCRRRRQSFESTYRCDSPTTKRLFRMTVTPRGLGELRVEHRLLRSTDIAPFHPVLVDAAERRSGARCSICAATRYGDDWIATLTRPSVRDFPPSYTVCPDCKAGAVETLRRQGGLEVPDLHAARR